MPVTSVEKDLDSLSLTIVADFAAPLARLWDAYVDPRQVERFWGPPTYPATFLRHDAAVGGRSIYRMTGPTGDQHYGYWEWTDLNAPDFFAVTDGFADETGAPNTELPAMHVTFAFEATDTGSRLTTITRFDALEQLEQLLEMGMLEGTKQAMSQIDDVLADLAAFAADRAAEAQLLGDTQARVARVIRGSVAQVWRAHNDAELMKKWLLGPDGGEGFGFTGELRESEPPHRAVTTEAMIGMDYPATVNELTLTPVAGGTLLTLVITYADAAQREAVLATGMTAGMETSYARLEELLESVSA
ncbi:SRPBCC family protein [uncultured Schumannella sp.]|uniref:SRPBCC family protein n=1 Tax=uncultured Schumannella sp. TaxID=1195956 RepID=UPI0025DDBBAA|nr:SRPBCC family protein [uncultured Schumannella sp.]